MCLLADKNLSLWIAFDDPLRLELFKKTLPGAGAFLQVSNSRAKATYLFAFFNYSAIYIYVFIYIHVFMYIYVLLQRRTLRGVRLPAEQPGNSGRRPQTAQEGKLLTERPRREGGRRL